MTMIDEVMLEEILQSISGFEVVASMLSSATNLISLVAYVLTAYSFYTIAQRRGIKDAWLAWVPVLQLWIVGAIADDYQRKAKNTASKKRKILLGLVIAKVAAGIVVAVMVIGAIFALLSAGYTYYDDWTDWAGVIGSFSGLVIAVILLGGIGVVQKVVEYFALYDVYCSCDPGNSLLFVLVNVFIGITKPIFLLICHKKDGGMPSAAEPRAEE